MVSFNLATAIPANAYDVLTATLTMRQTSLFGTPYTATAPVGQMNGFVYLYLFGINMTPGLNLEEYDMAPICTGTPIQCSMSSVGCLGTKFTLGSTLQNYTATVTKLTDVGFKSTAKRVSFRLDRRWSGGNVVGCPPVAPDTDGAYDYAILNSSEAPIDKPTLSVTYTYP